VNYSTGDIAVAIIIALFLFGVIGDYQLPGLTVPISILLGAVSLSVIVPSIILGDTGYFNPLVGVFTLIKLVGSVAWFVAMYVLLKEDTKTQIWRFAVFSGTLSTVFAMVAVVNSFFFSVRRPNGPFDNTNMFAIYLLFNIFLLLTLFFYSNDRSLRYSPRLLLIPLVIGVHLLAIISTASRATVVGGGVALVLVLLPEFKKAIRSNPIVTAFVVSLGLGGLIAIIDDTLMVNRIAAAMSGSQTGHRATMWSGALRGFVEYPLVGIGLGQHQFYLNNPSLPDTPHNTYISFIEETGILGFIAFSWVLIEVLRDSTRRWASKSEIIQVRFVLGFILAVLAFGVFHGIENFRSFWMAIGITVSMLELNNR
jgi:O-antigen ligase